MFSTGGPSNSFVPPKDPPGTTPGVDSGDDAGSDAGSGSSSVVYAEAEASPSVKILGMEIVWEDIVTVVLAVAFALLVKE